MEINTDTHPLSEIEYQYLWDAIPESEWTTNVVYWRAVCSVVASIADGRAKRARLLLNAHCFAPTGHDHETGYCIACEEKEPAHKSGCPIAAELATLDKEKP